MFNDARDAIVNKPFWAKLTSFNGAKYYAWTEQTYISPTVFVNMDGGRFGTVTRNPAADPNGATVSLPKFVMLRREYYDKIVGWVYSILGIGGSSGSSSALEVVGSTGAPDILNTTKLTIEQRQLNLKSLGFGNPEIGVRHCGALVNRSNAQNIPFGVAEPGTQVSFDTVDWDTDSFFSLGSPTLFTIPFDGFYILGGAFQFNGAGNVGGDPTFPTTLVYLSQNPGLIGVGFNIQGGPAAPLGQQYVPTYMVNGAFESGAITLSMLWKLFAGQQVSVNVIQGFRSPTLTLQANLDGSQCCRYWINRVGV